MKSALEVASDRRDSGYTSILAIIIGLFLPLANSRLAVTNSIGEALDFVGVFHESFRTFGPVLLVLMVSIVLGFVILMLVVPLVLGFASAFGAFLFAIGLLFTVVCQIVLSHLYGQLRRAVNREPPLPPRA